MNDGLKESHRTAIASVLAAFPRFDKAILFGSRAMGTFSPTSDIDLALYGEALTLRDLSQVADKLEECYLPVDVDLLRYDAITSQPLKDHIARYGRVFWEKS